MFCPLPIELTYRLGEFNLMFRDSSYASKAAALNVVSSGIDDRRHEFEKPS